MDSSRTRKPRRRGAKRAPTNRSSAAWDDNDPVEAVDDDAHIVPAAEPAQPQGAARRRLEEYWESRRLQGALRDVYDER